jgi:hypothetical protein
MLATPIECDADALMTMIEVPDQVAA